jgi:type III secretory pathway component EscU
MITSIIIFSAITIIIGLAIIIIMDKVIDYLFEKKERKDFIKKMRSISWNIKEGNKDWTKRRHY